MQVVLCIQGLHTADASRMFPIVKKKKISSKTGGQNLLQLRTTGLVEPNPAVE